MADLKALVKQMAEERELGEYWPLIDYIITNESDWDASVQSSAIDPGTGKRENSWGLFQLLIDSSKGPGLGAGHTPEDLKNPALNAEIALNHIQDQLRAGQSLQVAVDDWTVTHGIDVNNIAGGITAAGSPSPTGTPVSQGVVSPWEREMGVGSNWGAPTGATPTDTTGTDYFDQQQANFERQYPFTADEQRLIFDLTNMVDLGQLKEDQAWKILEEWRGKENITTQRAQEATTRGTNLLAGALPTPTLPMTGPGGMSDILSKRYGIPDIMPTGFQGLPMEQAQGIYGQAQQQVGLPAQLPPLQQPNIQLPNWDSFMQGMPQFGGGNRNSYIDQLLQEGRSTAPALG